MKLINYDEYNSLRCELNEFVVLCKKYNYTPSKNDFDDIIRFILLQSGSGTTTLCESYEINPFKLLSHLYESFEFDESFVIDEAGEGQEPYTGERDFDSAMGSATSAVTTAAAGAAIGAVATGVFISYLFKKGKIKKLVKAELDAELNKLKGWTELANKRNELGKRKGETSVKIDWPGMASGGGSKE
jgi:hypothetical protein